MQQIQQAIERFLATSKQPILCEPGEESVAITENNFRLEARDRYVTLHAWNDDRSLVRRLVGVKSETRGRLDLHIQRLGKRPGTLTLADLGQPRNQSLPLRAVRQGFRDTFRHFLSRQFPDYKIAELSTEANLQQSLSPSYPRALLRRGASALAAIAAPPDGLQADGVLSFGLIWLDYLRRREPRLAVSRLVLYLPAEHAKTTCMRLRYLNKEVATYCAFTYSDDGAEYPVDLSDWGNLDTHLEPCRRRIRTSIDETVDRLGEIPGVEKLDRGDGEISLRVRGLEFARTAGDRLLAGIETKRVTSASNVADVVSMARELARLRSPGAADHWNPLYLRNRELWLESEVRASMSEIDATLAEEPVYGQVPALAATDRGVLDLLGADHSGRLSVIELKASEDIHLPLQAVDYWMRVKWHLDRGDLSRNGYFPGVDLRTDAPRILMISPALAVHPTNEQVLRYISPAVDIEHVGVGIEWQKELKVMFRVKRQCR